MQQALKNAALSGLALVASGCLQGGDDLTDLNQHTAPMPYQVPLEYQAMVGGPTCNLHDGEIRYADEEVSASIDCTNGSFRISAQCIGGITESTRNRIECVGGSGPIRFTPLDR